MEMKNYGNPSAKIVARPDGTIKGIAKDVLGAEVTTVSAKKNGIFSKIIRQKDYKGETVEVTHSAWGKDFYHQDIKFSKFFKEAVMDEEFCKRKLQEKQNLRLTIKEIIKG